MVQKTLNKIIFILFVVVFICCARRERPKNLSENAEWIGGVDGGVWVILNQSSGPGDLSFAVYDEKGRLWVNNYFRSKCNFKKEKKLAEQIEAFDGVNFLLKEKDANGRNCYLKQLEFQ